MAVACRDYWAKGGREFYCHLSQRLQMYFYSWPNRTQSPQTSLYPGELTCVSNFVMAM